VQSDVSRMLLTGNEWRAVQQWVRVTRGEMLELRVWNMQLDSRTEVVTV
jgi:hypothetical protein